MAHIVYISIGMGSTLHTSLELGRRLRNKNHQVTFVSHRDVGQWFDLHGFPFHRLLGPGQAAQQQVDDHSPMFSWRSLGEISRWVGRRRKHRRASLENDEIETLVKRLGPDLLIIDLECHFAVIATYGLGIPTVLASFFFTTFRSLGLPPLHTFRMPGGGLRNRLGNERAWLRTWYDTRCLELGHRFSKAGLMAAMSEVSFGTVQFSDLKALARLRAYPRRRETDRFQWLRPYMYRHLPVISFNAWELEFPHDRHPNLRYVGPVINRHRPEPYQDTASAEQWKRFKQAHAVNPTSRPRLIYCSVGSFLAPKQRFVQRLFELARRRKDWVLVIGLGKTVESDGMGAVPANVHLLEWAPQIDVLGLADCALVHAGISTINECIYCEVPMIIHSLHTVDQDGNAARMAWHRLAIVGNVYADSAQQIERNIERALGDAAMRRNLAAARKQLLAYEDTNTAVTAVENMLGTSSDS